MSRMPMNAKPGMKSEVIDELKKAAKDESNALSPRDRDFAFSLAESFDKYGRLSEKQEFWVLKLIEDSKGAAVTGSMAPKAAKHTTQELGSVSPIFALFDKAESMDIDWPRIKILVDGRVIKLSRKRAGLNININEDETRQWIGSLSVGGLLTLSTKHKAPAGLTKAILDFAVNPSTAAGAMGKRMRACCFCGRGLTSVNSLWYGYGPVCAEKWGLNWEDGVIHQRQENLDSLGEVMQRRLPI